MNYTRTLASPLSSKLTANHPVGHFSRRRVNLSPGANYSIVIPALKPEDVNSVVNVLFQVPTSVKLTVHVLCMCLYPVYDEIVLWSYIYIVIPIPILVHSYSTTALGVAWCVRTTLLAIIRSMLCMCTCSGSSHSALHSDCVFFIRLAVCVIWSRQMNLALMNVPLTL